MSRPTPLICNMRFEHPDSSVGGAYVSVDADCVGFEVGTHVGVALKVKRFAVGLLVFATVAWSDASKETRQALSTEILVRIGFEVGILVGVVVGFVVGGFDGTATTRT